MMYTPPHKSSRFAWSKHGDRLLSFSSLCRLCRWGSSHTGSQRPVLTMNEIHSNNDPKRSWTLGFVSFWFLKQPNIWKSPPRHYYQFFKFSFRTNNTIWYWSGCWTHFGHSSCGRVDLERHDSGERDDGTQGRELHGVVDIGEQVGLWVVHC